MVIIFEIIALIAFCSTSELFEEHYKEAEKILSKMTLEQKVAQMFFPRFNNDTKDEDITKKFPGGFVLYAIDFNLTDENIIINNIDYIQKLSQKTMKLPLGLAVDEEGGRVVRISQYHRSERFPFPHDIYNQSGLEGILKIDQEKRDLLKKFKMNVNLAPVADMSDNPADYIYPRTLGYSLNETINYIKEDVKSYVNDNFTCCAKHFPGYGNNIDTNTDVAIDEREYNVFLNVDLKPFQAGIEEKLPMILVSHNIVKCKDDKYPASISKTWHEILRNELNYSGLILTDDLSMDAIKKYSGVYSPAIIAINAGNDILLTSDFNSHLEAVIEAVKNGTISEDTVNKACRRILAWKIKYLGAKYNEENEKDHSALIICLFIVGIIIFGFIIFIALKLCVFKRENNSDSIDNINTVENLI